MGLLLQEAHATFQAKLADVLAYRKVCKLFDLPKQVGSAHAYFLCQFRNSKLIIGNILLNDFINFPKEILFSGA